MELYNAIQEGKDLDTIQSLLSQPNTDYLTFLHPEQDDRSCFLIACEYGQHEILQMLLADPRMVGKTLAGKTREQKETALILACNNQCDMVVEILLSKLKGLFFVFCFLFFVFCFLFFCFLFFCFLF